MTERAEQELLPLYVRLYFDEDVPVDIVRSLRQRAFDVLSTEPGACNWTTTPRSPLPSKSSGRRSPTTGATCAA